MPSQLARWRPQAPLPRVGYVGVVEGVEERDGDHFSPNKGHKPLNCVYVRLAQNSVTRDGELIRVMVFDLYSPALYGQKGDVVSFGKLGRIPTNDEVWFATMSMMTFIPRLCDSETSRFKSSAVP